LNACVVALQYKRVAAIKKILISDVYYQRNEYLAVKLKLAISNSDEGYLIAV
jgi:hypothetical protein